MNRKEQILLVSKELFNQLGESNVTSVDIANELDISPGNLYYHFKGKEEIIASLVRQLSRDFQILLEEDARSRDSLIDKWVFIYFFLEAIYSYRFLFRNIPDIIYNYEDSGTKLMRLLEQVHRALFSFLIGLAKAGEIGLAPEQKNLLDNLVKSMMLVLIYWESYQTLNKRLLTEIEFIQDASLQILTVLSPYFTEDQIRDVHQCHQQYLREKTA